MHLTPSRCSWLADSHRSPLSFTSFLDAFPFRIRILLVIVWPVGSYIRWTQVRSFFGGSVSHGTRESLASPLNKVLKRQLGSVPYPS